MHRDASGIVSKPPELIPHRTDYTGVWGSGSNDVYATDRGGNVLHFDGTSWAFAHTAARPLNAVWGSGANDVYAAGDDGVVWRWNGSTWTKVVG
jgi:hypothetical protein